MNFTLIIPVAPGRNAEILDAIGKLDYPASAFEVIVARGDNPSANRNIGARQAKGEIVVFLDDDAVIPRNYLREAAAFFMKHPDIDIVGGPQLTGKEDPFFSQISWYALSSFFGTWKVSTRYSLKKARLNADETAVTSANLLCRKKVLEKVRFDARFYPGEDPRFIADAQKSGFSVAYTPAIRLYHRRRPNIIALMRQIYGYGKARPRKETLRETLKRPFFLIPSLFLIYLFLLTVAIISGLWSAADFAWARNIFAPLWPGKHVILMPLFLYILLALFFAIYDGLRNKNCKAMFFLPFVYAAIHMSYGAGMIMGYLGKFSQRKQPEHLM